jgi:hypothetical protein
VPQLRSCCGDKKNKLRGVYQKESMRQEKTARGCARNPK